jgi:predicted transcriptional regulator
MLGRRLALGLSQAALSERCGVPQADISRIERGQANPTIATVERLMSAMGGGSVAISWKAS